MLFFKLLEAEQSLPSRSINFNDLAATAWFWVLILDRKAWNSGIAYLQVFISSFSSSSFFFRYAVATRYLGFYTP